MLPLSRIDEFGQYHSPNVAFILPQLKQGYPTLSTSITAAATFTSNVIDLLGIDFATIDVFATTQSASTLAGGPTTLKLQEADVTNSSSFADIVGFRGGSATATNVDFIIGIGATATSTTVPANAYKFNVDCRSRKRYIQVVASPTTTQSFSVAANLGRAEQAPNTAAKANVLNLVEG